MKNMLIFLAIYVVFILGAGTVVHVLNAIGLVALARKRNIPGANLAWIPFFGIAYITGAVADDQTLKETGNDKRLRIWLLWMIVMLFVLTGFLLVQMLMPGTTYSELNTTPFYLVTLFLTLIIGMPFTVFWYIAHYRLFKSCQPNNATLFTVLSILFSIAPFLVFAVRHYVDGQEMRG